MADLFETLSPDQIRDEMLAGAGAEIPTEDRSPGSLLHAEYGGVSVVLATNHAHLDVLERSVTPLNADESGLILWSLALTLPRKAGAQAGQLQALRFVDGTPATLVPAGTALITEEGITYETTAVDTVDGDGIVVLDVIATEAGEAGNAPVGTPMSLVIALVGLPSAGVLIRDVVGGTDEETLGAWRARLLLRWQKGLQGGSVSDYQQWCLLFDFVDRVFIYGKKPTIDSVGIVALRSGPNQILTTVQESELLNRPGDPDDSTVAVGLNLRRPITDIVRLFTVVLRRVDVDVIVTLIPGSVPDFTDPLAGLTVSSYDTATRTITTNETLPTDLAAGDLATVAEARPTTGGTGEPVRIAAVTGATTFVIAPLTSATSDPIPWTVVGGEAITPSSAAMVDVRTGVLQGVAVILPDGTIVQVPGLESYGPANPGMIYGVWRADYDAPTIAALGGLNPFVSNSFVAGADSTASVEFPFPNDTTVELLVPGQILVKT